MFERNNLDWGEGQVSLIETTDNIKKPGLQFAHATGFNALTYKEILEPLSEHFNIRAVDARGHGFTELKANPENMYDWKIYCDDLIRSVEIFANKIGEPIMLSGHSMGAASAIQVAAKRPDLVNGLVLVEPVLMPNAIKRIFRLGRKYPLLKIFPFIKQGMILSESTKKRRRNWKDKEEMFLSYKNKQAFITWPQEILKDYIDGGTEEIKDGVRLTCDPLWEAATFSCWKHDAMGMIKELNCPITLLQGEFNSTTRADGPKQLMERDKEGVHKVIKGASHFLPMEFPEIVRNEIINMKLRIQDLKNK
mgnify:CR=1 FL=1|tara:strand:+ start:761 stop:1681 length:921 start_codon:yes stop_codon:yes gene_type:complete